MKVIKNDYLNVSEMLKAGFDVNMRDSSSNTPLMDAARLNRKDIASLLLYNKADIFLTDTSGCTAVEHALRAEANETFYMLAATHIARAGAPLWLQSSGQIAVRVSALPYAGIVCEHFNFADKMCTSALYQRKSVSHSRLPFNLASRQLIAEARAHAPGLKPAPRSKFKPAEL
jgi:ankyrin repeat protein